MKQGDGTVGHDERKDVRYLYPMIHGKTITCSLIIHSKCLFGFESNIV